MVDSPQLLSDLTQLLGDFERDLREQLHERADVRAAFMTDYEAARRVGRTQSPFETWIEEPVTQAAVAWILGTVFARFLEDNGLVEPRLSGTGARHTRAVQEHQHYFQEHPTDSDRDYLEDLFTRLSALPAMEALFDRRHNPLWRLPLSADAARQLVEFWQRIDPDLGGIAHNFADDQLDTRFLGDLYQDLSESVRKRYALLQTPEFVERFILDRTLTPAIDAFGYREVRIIDPTCGSGHFLLGAFWRLLALAQEHEPSRDVRGVVADVLSRVVGVDINPYAVAIARFRLMISALRACEITHLADAPGFDIPVVVADSLLHGPRLVEDGAFQMSVLPDDPANQYYFAEDEPRVRALLGRQYHAVVGNPPYITVKDPALNALYRQRYGSCHRQYALVVPFMERVFELALPGRDEDAGFVGMIVGNSFMKREFGKKLIEQYLPKWDVTHVVDTSGAYIPGHGTPTVILFGRHRHPETPKVRAVMGIRGEPSTPEDPGSGLVWTAILGQIDRPGSEGAFVSVTDLEREALHHHPWSIGGGGAAELKELLDDRAEQRLENLVSEIGRTTHTGEDEAFYFPISAIRTRRLGPSVPVVEGEGVRDYQIEPVLHGVFPYSVQTGDPVVPSDEQAKHFWSLRARLRARMDFGHTPEERGLRWFDYSMFFIERFRTPLSIAFAEVASHNHFVLDRGGKMFKQTAPVIKLSPTATEDDHLALLGLLNSSVACFWMKQVSHQKQLTGGDGVRVEALSKVPFAFSGTQLGELPIPSPVLEQGPWRERLLALSSTADRLGRRLDALSPTSVVKEAAQGGNSIRHAISEAIAERRTVRGQLVCVQEELDWLSYSLFGLTAPEALLGENGWVVFPGERPFEIASGVSEDDWPVPTGIPSEWPMPQRHMWERRIQEYQTNPSVRLVEQAKYKRRWIGRQGLFNHARNQDEWAVSCAGWLLDRLESPEYWCAVGVTSVAKLADCARRDPKFVEVAEVYSGRPDFDVTRVVDELVRDEAVPFLPVLRYTESGLRKRAQWEHTWELQREEDAIDARVQLPSEAPRHLNEDEARRVKAAEVGDIAVPPKYTSADFKGGPTCRLRSKLDVPKERFVSYPGCERAADGSLAVAWAGWDHAQQARALGDYYMQIKNEEGSASPKLVPLLAGFLELLPWIRQWHAGPDQEFGLELGDYYAGFLDIEARALGLTTEAVAAWVPAKVNGRGGRRGRRASKQEQGSEPSESA